MGVDEIVVRLQEISTSRLVAISSLYDTDCETSKVLKLHSALKKAIEKNRKEVKVKVDVSHDEVLDMFDALEESIEFYKRKYRVRVFPKDLNIFQVIDALKKVNAEMMIKDIIIESSKTKKVVPKETVKENPKVLTYAEKRKLILLSKQP